MPFVGRNAMGRIVAMSEEMKQTTPERVPMEDPEVQAFIEAFERSLDRSARMPGDRGASGA
jgi:hypothetical protein